MCCKLAPNRVALLVAEGLEEIEGLTVVDLLFRAGIPCDTISIVPERTVTSSHKVTIVCDRSLADEDFSFADYGLVVLPGGVPGTPNLAACKPLTDELCRRMAAELGGHHPLLLLQGLAEGSTHRTIHCRLRPSRFD